MRCGSLDQKPMFLWPMVAPQKLAKVAFLVAPFIDDIQEWCEAKLCDGTSACVASSVNTYRVSISWKCLKAPAVLFNLSVIYQPCSPVCVFMFLWHTQSFCCLALSCKVQLILKQNCQAAISVRFICFFGRSYDSTILFQDLLTFSESKCQKISHNEYFWAQLKIAY